MLVCTLMSSREASFAALCFVGVDTFIFFYCFFTIAPHRTNTPRTQIFCYRALKKKKEKSFCDIFLFEVNKQQRRCPPVTWQPLYTSKRRSASVYQLLTISVQRAYKSSMQMLFGCFSWFACLPRCCSRFPEEAKVRRVRGSRCP